MDWLLQAWHGFGQGLASVLSWVGLAWIGLGAVIGSLIGVLPGLGPIGAIALLFPVVYVIDTSSALMLLASVYYGAQYGGSTAAILMNTPGATSAEVTAWDGHPMAAQGRAGVALMVAVLGSFAAGLFATVALVVLAAPLAAASARFSSVELFALCVLVLVGSVVLSSGSLLKSFGMILLGMLLAQVGTDAVTGVQRFTGGHALLAQGVPVAVLAIALFALGQILAQLQQPPSPKVRLGLSGQRWRPTREEWRRAWPAALRGSTLGAFLGMLPGGGALLASFASYVLEERLASDEEAEEFGQGAIQGVAGPESANNAGAQTSFMSLLWLGVPTNPVMALMAAAMMIKAEVPGPQWMGASPDLFWGLLVSMAVGNLLLLVLNGPLVGLWAACLKWSYRVVAPVLVLVAAVGLYGLNLRPSDILLATALMLAGYTLYRMGCEPGPMLLGFVMAPLMERHLRQALQAHDGRWGVVFSHPLALGMMLVAALLFLMAALPAIRAQRDETFVE